MKRVYGACVCVCNVYPQGRPCSIASLCMYVCMYVTLRNVTLQECHASGMRNWVWLRLINLQTDLLLTHGLMMDGACSSKDSV